MYNSFMDDNYKKIFNELKQKNSDFSDRLIDFYILKEGLSDGKKEL